MNNNNNNNGFIPDPIWPPSVDNDNVYVTDITQFYVVEEVKNVVTQAINYLNNNHHNEMLNLSQQMNVQGLFDDPFCTENALLDSTVYCNNILDDRNVYKNVYTSKHNGKYDIIQPEKNIFYEHYGNKRLNAYKDVGLNKEQLDNIFEGCIRNINENNPQANDAWETNLKLLYLNAIRDAVLEKNDLLNTVFYHFRHDLNIYLNNDIVISDDNFPSLDIPFNVFVNFEGGSGKKYKNKIVNIPVIPEKKTRKNKKPKECYKNCESVPSGLCATGCKPSWTSKRKIRSRNWCHCNIDKTKCSIHICRSKTKKKKNKKNKKKYSKNKSRKSK
tara:strand:+ start:821 stop:1810 length:990 start_codon:yes stop_codon:yes gene_type:complete